MENASWISDKCNYSPSVHKYKKYESGKIPFGIFCVLIKKYLTCINLIEANFGKDIFFYSFRLGFTNRRKDTINGVVFFSDDNAPSDSPGLCLFDIDVNLRDHYRNYCASKDNEKYLHGLPGNLIKVYFLQSTVEYARLISETKKLITYGIQLKPRVLPSESSLGVIDFSFINDGFGLSVDYSLNQFENKNLETILAKWHDLCIQLKSNTVQFCPSKYTVSFQRSIRDYLHNL